MPTPEYVEYTDKSTLNSKTCKSIYGYSLRVQTSVAVYSYSISGIIVVLGFAYLCSILIKQIVIAFGLDRSKVAHQGHAMLDISAHIKSD